MIHLLAVTTNRSGVLARITSIVCASGINIETAAAYPMGEVGLSVVHLCIRAEAEFAERVRRKVARLVDVIEVRVEAEAAGASVQLGLAPQVYSAHAAPTA